MNKDPISQAYVQQLVESTNDSAEDHITKMYHAGNSHVKSFILSHPNVPHHIIKLGVTDSDHTVRDVAVRSNLLRLSVDDPNHTVRPIPHTEVSRENLLRLLDAESSDARGDQSRKPESQRYHPKATSYMLGKKV